MIATGVLLALGGGAVGFVSKNHSVLQEAWAFAIPDGMKEIGKINGAPVLKAPTNDMDDSWFQKLTEGIFGDIGTPSHIIKQVTWGKDTYLFNGQDLSSFGQTAQAVFEGDGYLPTDKGINLQVGQTAVLQNVGTAVKTATGEEIPLSLVVRLRSVQGFGSSTDPLQNLDSALLMAKSQNGVLTLGWGTLSTGGSESGGTGESGGVGGGASDGSSMMFIDNINYGVILVDSRSGKALPDDTLMPIKMSDIDASQLATMGGEGALGYVVSPDTELSLSGNGMVATSEGSINEDTTQLSSNSYLVMKKWNNNTVGYKYTDGKNNHMDIVTGIFGVLPSWKVGGYIEIDKSTNEFGKNPWNGLYSFDKLSFDVINSQGKVVDTIRLTKEGKGKSKYLTLGTYTLKEKASNWSATGQTIRPDMTVKVEAGKTVTAKPKNTAVQGKIKIVKSLKDYGSTLPNSLYKFEGIKFEVISEDKKYKDTITLGKNGEGLSKGLPLGKYDVKEIPSSVTQATGQVVNPTVYKVELKYANEQTELVISNAPIENKPVLGQIKIKKSGVESGFTPWNQEYTLAGNEFEISPKNPTEWAGGKFPLKIKTNDKGETETGKNLPLGKYLVKEIAASPGFVNTFEPVEVELTWKNNTTELVYGEATGKNQEIKGQNTLEKEDNETGKESQGKATMKDAEYALFYGDTSTGSSPHKKGEPVKWSDVPKAKVLAGEKVTKSIINGKEVVHGDNIVLNVDDEKLHVAIGNLALGKYEWHEINAPEGYVSDDKIHAFEIKKKDDVTQNIVTPDSLSKEQVIQAKITLQKLVEIPGESAESGYNGVEFTLSPLEGTKGEDVVMTTGVNEKTDEDGYAETMIVYGDYVMKETKGVPGYEPIRDIYIHMETDTKTDILTISASHNADFSEPFSIRKFSLSDNLTSPNPNAAGTVGTVSAEKPTISLSKLTLTNKATPEPPVEPEPLPQPHKFTVEGEKVDLTGESLLDDDDELTDRYKETNANPYSDKIGNNEDYNLNTKVVQPGEKLNYQLWLDTTPYTEDSLLTTLQMMDDFDESLLTVSTEQVKVYDKAGNDCTEHFAIEIKDGKLFVTANEFADVVNNRGEAVQVVDTEKVPFGQYYKIEFVTTVKNDVATSVDIINTAQQFVVNDEGKEVKQPTEKRVNPLRPPTSPSKDVVKEDDGETIQGENVALASKFVYVLHSRQLEANRSKDITQWVIDDDYDERFDRFNGTYRVYARTDFGAYKKGDQLSKEFFKVEEKEEGRLQFIAQDPFLQVMNQTKDQAVSFSIHADFFRMKDSESVVNVFEETVNGSKEVSNEVETNTPKPEPHKFDLSKEQVDLTGNRLLDDDSELKDRYGETNKDPYVDQVKNNEKENINTQNVEPGQRLVYQLWLDTTPFDETSQLTSLSIVDTYDTEAVYVDTKDVKVYDSKGKVVTNQFHITEKEGAVTIAANVFVDTKDTKGKAVKIVDTKQVPLGQVYKVDIPMTVRKDVKAGKDIINTARQESVDSEGIKQAQVTEKRVNKVSTPLEKVAQALLPNTGETPSSRLLKVTGWLLLVGLMGYWKREIILRKYRRIRRQLSR